MAQLKQFEDSSDNNGIDDLISLLIQSPGGNDDQESDLLNRNFCRSLMYLIVESKQGRLPFPSGCFQNSVSCSDKFRQFWVESRCWSSTQKVRCQDDFRVGKRKERKKIEREGDVFLEEQSDGNGETDENS
ncbi:hypothetical protein F3Y22_tig00111847pilonHSYRG00136 [Hibiscus syriacus]|uniref:Uncharacterized protein n=1 Tax=Hibiscus syriacus TaxID=106335 RepID=A0A6A2XA22_HIBSY|nr:hypothetical protein F3Y22_tig00111847pilonHSYRG00136 [Hibiscus syriacus]